MNAADSVHGITLVAILAMAGVTYLMRVSGYWLLGQVPITARLRRMLEALPGSVMVAIVLPIVAKNGLPAFLAIGAAMLVMYLRRNDIIALLAGLAAAALARGAGL